MYLLFLLTLNGCAKRDMVKAARNAFTNQNCVKTLETYMRSAYCPEVLIEQRDSEILLRCEKPNNKRQSVWDRYWFRISPSSLKIVPEQLPEIEQHTICIDDKHRVEAYPPE